MFCRYSIRQALFMLVKGQVMGKLLEKLREATWQFGEIFLIIFESPCDLS